MQDPPDLPEGPICEPCGRPMIIHRQIVTSGRIVRMFHCTQCESVAVIEIATTAVDERQPVEG